MRPFQFLFDLPWWTGLPIFLAGTALVTHAYPIGVTVALFGIWTFYSQHQMWNITFHHIVPAFLEVLEHPGSEPTRLSIQREPIRIPLFSHAIRTNPSFSPPKGRRGPQITGTLPEAYLKAHASHSRTIEACAETLLRFLTAESRAAGSSPSLALSDSSHTLLVRLHRPILCKQRAGTRQIAQRNGFHPLG